MGVKLVLSFDISMPELLKIHQASHNQHKEMFPSGLDDPLLPIAYAPKIDKPSSIISDEEVCVLLLLLLLPPRQ